MDKFLSCDWGTSSFRLRLVEAGTLAVIAEEKNTQGIAETHRLWQQQNTERRLFYTTILQQHINVIGERLGISLAGIPVILSGMASSTIGLIELPYKQMPFSLDGSDLEVKVFNDGANPLVIISGAKYEQDVMRGEETKVAGCATYLSDSKKDILLILPGTHPKHIDIKGEKAVDVTTYMTGEFFDLLATKSVLAASVENGGNISEPANRESFIAGIKAGQTGNLLHAAFMVRTNDVLDKLPKQHNYFYLSGLLIASELKEVKHNVPVYLVGGPAHLSLYALACAVMDIPVAGKIDADEALIRGQQLVFARHYAK